MNPKMIYFVAAALIELEKAGVQIIITTHSYFIQQAFAQYAEFDNNNNNLINSFSVELL